MKVELLDHQWEFLESKIKFTLLSGGIGSGKSWVGSHYIINRVRNFPNSLHFIGTNTYSQLRDSTLSCLFGVLSDLGISFSYNQNHGLLEFLGGKVLCKSMENFNSIRGIEIGTFWLDETRDLKEEAFQVLMGRLRCKNCDKLEGRLTSSPAGFNWLYDYFTPDGEHRTDEFELINASSFNNPHLPHGYIESMRDQYTEAFFKQEVLGEFINITSGRVYFAFDREKHVKDISRRPTPTRFQGSLYIGQDFNVDPLAGVVCEYIDNTLYVTQEIFLRDSNTFELARHIKKKHPGRIIKIIPDSTAKNRKTSGRSDIQILEAEGFEVMHTRNPYVMDRTNNVNRLLEQGKIVIDPKCKKLIADLEKVTWVQGKNQLDQLKDKMLTHVSDALGYACWKLMPMGGKTGVTITRR